MGVLDNLRDLVRIEEAIEADSDPDVSAAACVHLPQLRNVLAELERVYAKAEDIGYLVLKYFDAVHETTATAHDEITRLRTALEQVVRWDGFPKMADGHSYSYHWGSNGERDFMRDVAYKALEEGTHE
jgi:hypothetical protein